MTKSNYRTRAYCSYSNNKSREWLSDVRERITVQVIQRASVTDFPLSLMIVPPRTDASFRSRSFFDANDINDAGEEASRDAMQHMELYNHTVAR